jgi:hypothetical protein
MFLAGKEIDVVADPELRPGFCQELLKLLARSLGDTPRLFAVGHGIKLEILRIMIEIAAQGRLGRFSRASRKAIGARVYDRA